MSCHLPLHGNYTSSLTSSRTKKADCYVLIASSPCINTQKGKSLLSSLTPIFFVILFPVSQLSGNRQWWLLFNCATHSSTCLLVVQWTTISLLFFCPPFQTNSYQELIWSLHKGLFPENPLLTHELLFKLKDAGVSVRLAGNTVASAKSRGIAFATPSPHLHK